MKVLPPNVVVYKKTKSFDESSIPSGLLRNHNTIKGVWGLINILEGNLLYIIQSNPIEEIKLGTTINGVVEPLVPHCVQPIGKVKFYVEFYK